MTEPSHGRRCVEPDHCTEPRCACPADLPPDVRDQAAQAARDARQKYDNEHLSCNDHVRMLNVVDAVAAVLAPEIERPLQAQLDQSRKTYAEFVTGQHEEVEAERDALQAQNQRLRDDLRNRIALDELQWSGKQMTATELDEIVDRIAKGI